jgi:hypothetical protein
MLFSINKAIELFARMEYEGIITNAITFACALNSCSHRGLVKEEEMFFGKIKKDYGIEPNITHYGCMVDLFNRAGLFQKVEKII